MSGKWPKRKARPDVDEYGRTPLHYAASDGVEEEVARLLAAGMNPNAADDNGWTPLHYAAQAQSAEATRALLAAGADPDLRDSHGNAVLWRAVFDSRGAGSVIGLLRQAGANPHAANGFGVTPVSLARSISNFDVARFFSDLVGG